ncbi:hypothetical protein ABT160_22565 [Streptomyces sp. NPDC001941]|uniref:hypothetical protein n=1 Tax=Streptomyces sp. NPDC001941 TaxID=3154659 RepID=UPI003325506D
MDHLLLGLAANPSLPAALIDRLISVADQDIAHALAGRGDLRPAQVRALAARDEGSAVRLAYEGKLDRDDIDPRAQPDVALAWLSERPGPPAWARLLLARRRCWERLAACAGLPGDVVEALATDADPQVVAELATWTSDPALLGRLAAHPHAGVRSAVAGNRVTPPHLLAALLSGDGLPPALRCRVCDQEEVPFVHGPYHARTDCVLRPGDSCDGTHESTVHDIQRAALDNPATPADALLPFVDHPSILLRWALAPRTDLPPEAYERLARDPVPGVRGDLAENPAIGEAVMCVLADDDGHDVRRRLAHNPRVPFDLFVRLAGSVRIGPTGPLPRVATASPAEVEELARAAEPGARMLVALRRDLPPGVRDVLAADPDAKVVKSIASHPGLSPSQLHAMVRRFGVHVVARVAANLHAPPALLDELARQQPPVRKALREIARHPRATAATLWRCVEGGDERARAVVAGRPGLPREILEQLLNDPDPEVAEAASANPALSVSVMEELLRGRP